ncbi:uncharacterized protein LOC126894744 isoform X4 [Daktulosphaira vitifoliae]|uniref:uncharacterized protein LOC126894744 isoform X4 n=1 Tax=Daktulosphaira vitifoliae TaxID=58002 RepID=UPI0021AA3317|nr:uncharacterized protein LOC126894744 isoform X4 [Daktulosphaira vitifoliae]
MFCPDKCQVNSQELFKMILADHLKVNTTLKNFFEFIKPIIIVHLGLVFQIFVMLVMKLVLESYFKDNNSSGNLPIILVLCGVLAFGTCFNLFLNTYIFELVESQVKNAMCFAIYSCNWTDKNIQFKKLLLLSMKTCTANNLVMRITPTKYVNLALFASMMNLSYSIVSLLVKMLN